MKERAKSIQIVCILLGVIPIAVALACLWYCRAYPIHANQDNLEHILLSQAADLCSPAVPLTLQDSVTLGDITYQLAEVGPERKLLLFRVQRGPFSRFRPYGMASSSNEWYGSVIPLQKENYLLIGGRNLGRKIAKIECGWENGTHCTLDLPNTSIFLVCAALDAPPSSEHLDLDRMRFWDAAGQDITDDILQPGWGI